MDKWLFYNSPYPGSSSTWGSDYTWKSGYVNSNGTVTISLVEVIYDYILVANSIAYSIIGANNYVNNIKIDK